MKEASEVEMLSVGNVDEDASRLCAKLLRALDQLLSLDYYRAIHSSVPSSMVARRGHAKGRYLSLAPCRRGATSSPLRLLRLPSFALAML
jgi:hypothetical protein